MGYLGKLSEKRLAIKYRKKGLSYNEIQKHISVSKDTISRWCRNIELSQEQKDRLFRNKNLGLKTGGLLGAEVNKNKRIILENKIINDSVSQIGNLSDKEKFLVGVALYSGEGTKSGSSVEFTNSDPKLVQFFLDWLVEYCFVDKSNIKFALWLHQGLDEDKAKKYWSNLLSIPDGNFNKTYFAKVKTDSKKVRKINHPFGIIKVRYHNVNKLRQISGWIKGIFSPSLQCYNSNALLK